MSPWYELRIDANGTLTYCHASADKEITNDGFLKWFNSGKSISIARNQIQEGTPVSGCQKCYVTENKKLLSHRHRRNLQAAIYQGKYFQESLKQSPALNRMLGNVKNIKPAFMHVSLSNLCNLSCRMCNPQFSSNLTTVMKKINLISNDTPTLLDWTKDSSKWKEFCNLVLDNTELICLHFMGGEPLYNKKFYEFIDLCIDNNRTNFNLTFVTNGTFFNTSLIEKLKKFKSVAIEISVENFHITNDYIRMGSNYKNVQKNIKFLLRRCGPTIDVVLRTVPQALSIMHYYTLIDFALENNISIDFNLLSSHPFLKIFVLPDNIKQIIIDDLQSKYGYLLNYKISNIERLINIRSTSKLKEQMTSHIESLLELLNEPVGDNINELRQQFIKFNSKFDQESNFKFLELYPELQNFYHEYNTNKT